MYPIDVLPEISVFSSLNCPIFITLVKISMFTQCFYPSFIMATKQPDMVSNTATPSPPDDCVCTGDAKTTDLSSFVYTEQHFWGGVIEVK